MPRAHRFFLPHHVWHLTHRCHEQAMLLRFERDRRRYLQWLFEAKKRYGLCVLDYMVTCNHIHLLVQDTGEDIISRSMQLIAGRTAQEYNQRKGRKGAFWEDRYHATAIETGEHMRRCLVYIDLNMVRAGVVAHPAEWPHSGYLEIRKPPRRYSVIDLEALSASCGFSQVAHFQEAHELWVTEALADGTLNRDRSWSESIAVGNANYIAKVRSDLGIMAKHRELSTEGDMHTLREVSEPYVTISGSENGLLRPENMFFWNENAED